MYTLALLCIAVLSTATPIIRALESGVGGTISELAFGVSFCPFIFGSGFSVECVLPNATYVRFFINSKLVSEQLQPPFALYGHTNRSVDAWTNYTLGEVQISCVDNNGVATIWRSRLECVGSATPTPSVSPSPIPLSTNYCVTVRGDEFIPPLTEGWVLNNETHSVEYEPESNFEGIVWWNKAQLRYKFTVPLETTYGLTIDMGTKGYTEHNDVFISFDQGILLRKKNETVGPTTGFLKAYHNANGRSKQVFSIDFDPHTLSVSKALVPNVNYTVVIAARSTKTTVYGVMLFPCRGEECQSGQLPWQRFLHICNV